MIVVLIACGEKDPPVPATWKFEITVMMPKDLQPEASRKARESLEKLKGWEVRVGGKLAGNVLDPSGMRSQFEVPSTTPLASVTGGTAFVGKTPCGEWSIPIAPPPALAEYYAADIAKDPRSEQRVLARAGSSGKISLYTDFVPPEIKATPVYIDWGDATEPVRIGELELRRGETTVLVPGKPECGAEYPITVGGTAVGTWKAADAATFVSADAKLCHRENHKAYGQAGIGGTSVDYGAARVRTLQRAPDYFLKTAPEKVTTASGVNYAFRIEIVRVPCAAAPAPGSAAGSAK
jgi:hypothetical protein